MIVTVIEEMKARLMHQGTSGEKICVVPNQPVIEELESPKNDPDHDYITLIYSGGINYHRGLQVVIEGLAEIIKTDQNVRLWIIGKGSYLPNLISQVAQLNLKPYVKFWGWKSFVEMMELQAKADITLIPHLRSVQSDNSSPNKLYDYMYQKKPILASNCSSLVRLLKETGAGLTYSSTDTVDFVRTFQQMKEAGTRAEMGNNGYNAVLKGLNWGNSERALITAYRKEFKSN